MPYTDKSFRDPIDEAASNVFKLFDMYQLSAGDVNRLLTKIVLKYFLTQKSYQTACNIDGVLNNISKEFYARVVRPYEDLKIIQNGDLPEFIEILKWINERKKDATNNSKKR